MNLVLLENDLDLLKLMVSELRWPQHSFDQSLIVEMYCDLIDLTDDAEVQKYLVSNLPELVTDLENHKVYRRLISYTDSSELLPVTLDCIERLCDFNDEIVIELKENLLRRLDKVPWRDVPVLIRFLIRDLKLENECDRTISVLRKSTKLDTFGSTSDGCDQDDLTRIIEVLTAEIRFNSSFRNCWLKRLVNVDRKVYELESLDLIFLFTVYENDFLSPCKKKLEAFILKNLLVDEQTSMSAVARKKLLENTLRNSCVINAFFPAILSICEFLSISKRESSAVIYEILFNVVQEPVYQQEIVNIIMNHLSSGSNYQERLGFLRLLRSLLVEKYSHSNSTKHRFFNIVYQVFDYIEMFENQELEIIYEILSELAFIHTDMKFEFQNDLLITVRKQISNAKMNYRFLGIIAMCKLVIKVCEVEIDTQVGSSQSFCKFEKMKEERCQKMIKETFDSCTDSTDCLLLFYEQMVTVVKKISLKPLIAWIKEELADRFISDFVEEQDEEIECFFRRDDSTIVISLYTNYDKLSYFILLFRLLVECEKKNNNGSAEEIDGVLGYGLYLGDKNLVEIISGGQGKDTTIDEIDQVFLHLVSSLFYACLWFIDVIVAFAEDNFNDSCWTRIEDLLQAYSMLNAAVSFRKIPYSSLRHIVRHYKQDVNNRLQQKTSVGVDIAEVEERVSDFEECSSTSIQNSKPEFDTLKISYLETFIERSMTTPFFVILSKFEFQSDKQNYKVLDYVLEKLLIKLTYKLCPKYNHPLNSRRRIMDQNYQPDLELESFDTKESYLRYLADIGIVQGLKNLYQKARNSSMPKSELLKLSKSCIKCFKLLLIEKLDETRKIIFGTGPRDFIESTFNHEVLGSSFETRCLMLDLIPNSGIEDEEYVQRLYQSTITPDREDMIDQKYVTNNVLFHLLTNSYDFHSIQELSKYSNEILPALYSSDENYSILQRYVFLNKQTVVVYFKAAGYSFCDLAKHILTEENPKVDQAEEYLGDVRCLVSGFFSLLSLVKQCNENQMLISAMKYGRQFVEYFTKFSFKKFDKLLKTHSDTIVQIIQEIQSSTRLLQTICNTGKQMSDKTLKSNIPSTKKTLESFVIALKTFMSRHNLLSVVFVGALKHKLLQGMIENEESDNKKAPKRKKMKPEGNDENRKLSSTYVQEDTN